MKIFQCLYPAILILMIVITACDNPVQTEQQLDSWNNLQISGNMESCYNLAASPDGQSFAMSQREYLTYVITTALQQTDYDTIYTIYGHLYNNNPILSPDGQQVLYTTYDNELIMENMLTGEKNILVTDFQYNNDFQWSRDGQKIHYRYSKNLFTLDINTKQTTSISLDMYSQFYNETWMQDDEQVLFFERLGHDHYFTYYRLISYNTLSGTAATLVDSSRVNSPLALSPDGQKVVFMDRDSTQYKLELYDLQNNTISILDSSIFYYSNTCWLHDGQSLVYYGYRVTPEGSTHQGGYWQYNFLDHSTLLLSEEHSSGYQLHPVENKFMYFSDRTFYKLATITRDSVVTEISKYHETMELNPAWSPDGNSIVFNDNNLYQVPVTGGKPVELLPGLSGYKYRPELSPDQKHIAFDDKYYETMIYDIADGSRLGHIYNALDPSWSPEGDKLVCYYDNEVCIYDITEPSLIKKLYTCNIENVTSVEWLKSKSPYGYDILCTAYDESGYQDVASIILLDSTLEDQLLISKNSRSKYWASWLPGGDEISFLNYYSAELVIKGVFSEF